MKRAVVILALALVVASSAQAAAPASPRSVKKVAAARKHAAWRQAGKLLHELVAPPGAKHVLGWPHDYGFKSRIPNTGPIGEFVDRHQIWILHSGLAAVVAFERHHVPAGFQASGGGRNASGSFTQLYFDSPPRGIATQILVVSISQRQTRTIVRADSQVVWVYPRSPQETVPATVREIDIEAPKVSRQVRDPARVAMIVRWFDRLPISPPGVAVPCPLLTEANVKFVFRSANGVRVAGAAAPAIGKAGVCDSIWFSIDDKQQTPLTDAHRGSGFVGRVGRLLGIHFPDRP